MFMHSEAFAHFTFAFSSNWQNTFLYFIPFLYLFFFFCKNILLMRLNNNLRTIKHIISYIPMFLWVRADVEKISCQLFFPLYISVLNTNYNFSMNKELEYDIIFQVSDCLIELYWTDYNGNLKGSRTLILNKFAFLKQL